MEINMDLSKKKKGKAFLEDWSDLGHDKVKQDLESCKERYSDGSRESLSSETAGKERGPQGMEINGQGKLEWLRIIVDIRL